MCHRMLNPHPNPLSEKERGKSLTIDESVSAGDGGCAAECSTLTPILYLKGRGGRASPSTRVYREEMADVPPNAQPSPQSSI